MRISLCCQWLPLVVYNYTIDIGRQQWLPSYHPHPPHTRPLRVGIIYKLADYLISLLSICPNYWPISLSTSGSDQRQRHKNWASYLSPLPNGSFSGTWTVDNQNIFVFGKMELLWKDLENIYSHFHSHWTWRNSQYRLLTMKNDVQSNHIKLLSTMFQLERIFGTKCWLRLWLRLRGSCVDTHWTLSGGFLHTHGDTHTDM